MSSMLYGFSLVHHSQKDQWGWGCTGFYSASHRFSMLQPPHSSLWPSSLWKDVWDSFSMPKVKNFTWMLMHNRVLSGENLIKRGFNVLSGVFFATQLLKLLITFSSIVGFLKLCGGASFMVCMSLFLLKMLFLSFLASGKIRIPSN